MNTNKSILIIDTPKSCIDCNFFDDSGDYNFCNATQTTRGWRLDPYKECMDNCPLVPLERVCKIVIDVSKEE